VAIDSRDSVALPLAKYTVAGGIGLGAIARSGDELNSSAKRHGA
jgi:hypothetical protein